MVKTWQPKTVRIEQKGLAMLLGKLELQVMDVVWKKGCISVRQVCDDLCKKRDFSFNTIMTIMNRLTAKGLLVKSTKEGMYCYEASLPKEKFKQVVSQNILSHLLNDSQVFSIESFAKAMRNLSKTQMSRFTKMIKQNNE